MTPFEQIKTGLAAYGKSIRFVFKNKMAWSLIVPVVLSILLFVIAQSYVNDLAEYLKSFTNEWGFIQNSKFLGGFFKGLIAFITELVFIILFAYLGGYIVLMRMSPLLSYLSEKTEQILTGNEYQFSAKQMLKDTARGILMALRNMIIETLIVIPAFILSFVPVIGIFAGLFMFLLSAYFYGFSFIDYINERQKLNIKQSVQTVRKYKWIAIANGSVFALPLVIPVIGAQIAGFVSVFSVVAATIAIVEIRNNS